MHRRSPWMLGSAGAAKPFRGHTGRLGPARVRRQGRTAKGQARPAGEAEDTGAAAALDGRSARRGQARRRQRRAGGGYRHRRDEFEGVGRHRPLARCTRAARIRAGNTKRVRSPFANQPVLCHRVDGAATDDQVIEYPHVHQREPGQFSVAINTCLPRSRNRLRRSNNRS